MARKDCRPSATSEHMLTPLCTQCAGCGQPMWVAFHTQRTITTLQGICRLSLCIRRCRNQQCEWYHRPYRPEEEGRWALPHGEFGLASFTTTIWLTSHSPYPELEQYFGSARYHERRATGRKQTSPVLVVSGAVRVVASIASRLHPFSGPELCPTDLTRWHTLRSELNHRHEARRMQHRFRKSPENYLGFLKKSSSRKDYQRSFFP